MVTDTIQISGSVAASNANDTLVSTTAVTAGELWYVDSVRVVGDSVYNSTSGGRNSGIRAGITTSAGASEETVKASATNQVSATTTETFGANATLGAYATDNEDITLRVVNGIDAMTSGTLYYVVHIRRIL